MKKIEFDAQFGSKTKRVELNFNEYGGGGFQLLIDRYYQGRLYFKDGMWRADLNERSELTYDDILALGERIEQEMPK